MILMRYKEKYNNCIFSAGKAEKQGKTYLFGLCGECKSTVSNQK